MTNMKNRKIIIFSRYQLSEQFDLAAEFQPMLEKLCSENSVIHMSFRNTHLPANIPKGLVLEEIPLMVNRNHPRDVVVKSILMYLMLPLSVWKIRRHKPDLVFLSEILPLVSLFFKWMGGCKVATAFGDWHVHNFLGKKWWIKPFLAIAESLERFEARRLDGLFCRATAASNRLQSWGIAENKIRVVFDAPDIAAFYPQDQVELRAKCGFGPDDTVLLYHGVMHQGKGLDMLLRCTADLYKDNKSIGIILVGSGPELQPLKQLAEDLGIASRCYFTGWLKTIHEVGNYCNAADICIAMRTGAESNVHIIPGALLHSMACRKVVIGPDLPGIREVIRPDENGFVFTADDPKAFVNLIKKLINMRPKWEVIASQAESDIRAKFSVDNASTHYMQALLDFADN